MKKEAVIVKCIIVDDEPLSVDIIRKYMQDIPFLHLTGTAKNAFEANKMIKEQEADVVFLDINMPKLSGIDLVKSLHHKPMIVFTTAYAEFAVEGFELDALDYLLKPFSFERFLKAVNKAYDKMIEQGNGKTDSGSFIMVKSDKRVHKIYEKEIRYLQSTGDYVKIIIHGKSIITHDTLKNLEQGLNHKSFCRIHKSFIVNIDYIEFLEGNSLKIRDEYLPIGASYKNEFLSRLNNT